MRTETGITKNTIVAELTKSPHGKLAEYVPVGSVAANQEPEFLSHLVAWNRAKGQIRDSKVALPVISLACREFAACETFRENSLAHLALLDPRNLLRALRFGKEIKAPCRMLDRLVGRYLRHKEAHWSKWERTALQHRRSMHELYALFHIKPAPMAEGILFKDQRPKGSVFEILANLKNMSAQEAAGHIMEKKIPFLIAMGAVGEKAKDPDLVLALINRMSPTSLVTNTKMLERLGVKTVPALRAAYQEALGRAGSDKKATFKATRAVEAVEDEVLKAKLDALQEKQIQALGGPEGDWLVLADKSGSMSVAIETARQVAAVLARVAKGNVHLVFFDSAPRYFKATGSTYEELRTVTAHVQANGATSIGCGLLYAIEKGFNLDGIAIVSDAKENTPPFFADQYAAFCQAAGKQVPVYLFRTLPGSTSMYDQDLADVMRGHGFDLQEFDLRSSAVDYYSLPSLVQVMRTQRYGLVDEIMAVPLLTLEDVLPMKSAEKEVTHA